MSDKNASEQRRRFLKMSAAGAAVTLLPLSWQAALAADRLDPNSAQAKAMSYVENASDSTHSAYQAGHNCSNCLMFTDPTQTEWGPCAVFPGKLVAAGGWCNAWVTRG